MKKKLIVASLLPMLILPFSTELSYSQPKQVNIHNPPALISQNKQQTSKYTIMKATAYDLSIQCCGKSYSDPNRGITRDGYNLNNKSHSEAWTVSSNKFPMGTKLFLEFPDAYKRYEGVYVVHDTGNFKDNVLDIYLGDFGEKVGKETINFGRVDVKVRIIE